MWLCIDGVVQRQFRRRNLFGNLFKWGSKVTFSQVLMRRFGIFIKVPAGFTLIELSLSLKKIYWSVNLKFLKSVKFWIVLFKKPFDFGFDIPEHLVSLKVSKDTFSTGWQAIKLLFLSFIDFYRLRIFLFLYIYIFNKWVFEIYEIFLINEFSKYNFPCVTVESPRVWLEAI